MFYNHKNLENSDYCIFHLEMWKHDAFYRLKVISATIKKPI